MKPPMRFLISVVVALAVLFTGISGALAVPVVDQASVTLQAQEFMPPFRILDIATVEIQVFGPNNGNENSPPTDLTSNSLPPGVLSETAFTYLLLLTNVSQGSNISELFAPKALGGEILSAGFISGGVVDPFTADEVQMASASDQIKFDFSDLGGVPSGFEQAMFYTSPLGPAPEGVVRIAFDTPFPPGGAQQGGFLGGFVSPPQPVPEPALVLLIGSGFMGLAGLRFRRARRRGDQTSHRDG